MTMGRFVIAVAVALCLALFFHLSKDVSYDFPRVVFCDPEELGPGEVVVKVVLHLVVFWEAPEVGALH